MAKRKDNEEELETIPTQESSVPATTNSNVPAHLNEFAQMGNVGFENVHAEDRVIPRLAVAQSTSDQRKKNNPLFIEGLEEGDFFNTLTNEIYGIGPLIITPIIQWPSRIYFSKRGSGQPNLCGTKLLDEDGRLIKGPITPQGCDLCIHSKFKTEPDEKGSISPPCTLFYNYGIALHGKNGEIEPLVLSAKSMMIAPAKKLNTLVHYRVPKLPAFTMLFEIKTVGQKGKLGEFFNISVTNANPKNVNAEQLASTKALYEMMSNTNLKVDERGLNEDLENRTQTQREERF